MCIIRMGMYVTAYVGSWKTTLSFFTHLFIGDRVPASVYAKLAGQTPDSTVSALSPGSTLGLWTMCYHVYL